MSSRPYGPIDPNSQHQLWSRWLFRICGKHIPLSLIESNAARWLRAGFGSVGRARVYEKVTHGRTMVYIEVEVEGVPAHDPGYVKSVRTAFRRFVEKGWGPLAWGDVEVTILAGDTQDGKPRSQLIVIPRIIEGN